ncbi:response regulator [Aquabacterium sp.]|uniref:response regulator n=1 Tax=Aquabacterium sp. TaxID=1872578 RepID=UPI002D0CCF24|nr:response regulator [Aquabacterium sp.]HSW03948.1 response regulator [Aquabacterium sp.]
MDIRVRWGCALGLWLFLAAATVAAPIDDWRQRATAVRRLADNDAPVAATQALRLQAELPPDAPAADRVRALNLLARIDIHLGRTAQAVARAEQALRDATAAGDRAGQAEADMTLALGAVNQNQVARLVEVTSHSIAVLEGVARPDLLAEALFRGAIVYRRAGRIEESVTMALQAMDAAQRSGDPLVMAYAHHGLAVSYLQSERRAETVEQLEQMRRQALAAGSRLQEGFALMGLSTEAHRRGDHAEGDRLIGQSIANFTAVGSPVNLGHAVHNHAEQLLAQRRAREALAENERARSIFATAQLRAGRFHSTMQRSQIQQALGHHAAALADAEDAYAESLTLAQPVLQANAARRLAELVASAGDPRRAYRLAIEAAHLQAQASTDHSAERMLQAAQRRRDEARQRELAELQRRGEQQAAELRARELQQRWLWTVLAGSIVALAGTVVFLERLRRSRAQVRGLAETLEQRVLARTDELRQQARYLRTLIDMLPMWAWFKDRDGRYLAVNQAAADTRGLKPEELVGKSDHQVYPPDVADAFRADDLEVMASRRGTTLEEAQAVPGDTIWLETFKAPVIDEDGTVLGTVGVARDISERKAAEGAREAALAEAQRLVRMRSEFLAQMSHELRTPLNGILGFAQSLQSELPLSERQARGLRIIEESGRHLLGLINDILDLARIDAGKLVISPSDVSLPDFLQAVCDMVCAKAEEKGLSFNFETVHELPAAVQVDEKCLRQVLLNLLSNAIKFTDSGHVTLRVEALPPDARDRPDPTGTQAMVSLRFEVHDTGIGMSEAQQVRLFQPFEQLADVRRREGGSGLGLAISRHVIRMMGADIGVQSQLGEGTLFFFELELPTTTLSQAVARSARGRPTGYHGPRKRVLVIDDEATNRAMLSDVLSAMGFDVLEACDGREGLDVAGRAHPDLIVTDVAMPEMDGFEATRRLREMPALSEVPVIATSASATQDVAVRCRDAGANAFIPKPIEQSTLTDTLARLMGLTWTYAQARPRLPDLAGPTGRESSLVYPPIEEMQVLRELARVGNMKSLRMRADQLRSLDTRYASFASRLAVLADGYQSRAITALVEGQAQ